LHRVKLTGIEFSTAVFQHGLVFRVLWVTDGFKEFLTPGAPPMSSGGHAFAPVMHIAVSSGTPKSTMRSSLTLWAQKSPHLKWSATAAHTAHQLRSAQERYSPSYYVFCSF
jgi:hypothetical protein